VAFLPNNTLTRKYQSWVCWLKPITLATWEAEIGKITVTGQHGQKLSQDTIFKQKRLSTVGHACHPSHGIIIKQEDQGPDQPGKKGQDPISKITRDPDSSGRAPVLQV
jgi:hypothetical protein